MSLHLPTFCHVPCIAAVVLAAMCLASCGRKDADTKVEDKVLPASAPEKAPTEEVVLPPGPATTNSLGNVLVGKEHQPLPQATEEEKTAMSGKAAELMKARRAAMRRSAMAEEKLAARARALETSDDPVIQGAVKLVNDRKMALDAAKATVEAAEASLADARKALEKAFATDSVWAEFKAETEAVLKEENNLRARLQAEIADAHRRGFHLQPPSSGEADSVPKVAPEASPSDKAGSVPEAPASGSPDSSNPSL